MPLQTQTEDMAQLNMEAKTLVTRQRTLVLATCISGSAWSTPVYYVYSPPGFCFFSSPRSRHVAQAQANPSAAAAISSDGEQWEQIQGIQMSGKIAQVTRKLHIIRITGSFLIKFPFARSFLENSTAPGRIGLNISERVCLYAFIPEQIFYTNNRFGFGRRFAVSIDQEGELHTKRAHHSIWGPPPV
jgi:uncharacterized protein YhbP (UPF0306 family)